MSDEVTTHVWDGANIVLERTTPSTVFNRFVRSPHGELIRSDQHGFYLYNAGGDVLQQLAAAPLERTGQ